MSGSTTGSDVGCQTAASTTVATCNGNGDGIILNNANASNEPFRFWQHLANAGLIEGNYNGIPTASTTVGTTIAKLSVQWKQWVDDDWGFNSRIEHYHNPNYDRNGIILAVFKEF